MRVPTLPSGDWALDELTKIAAYRGARVQPSGMLVLAVVVALGLVAWDVFELAQRPQRR